MQYSRKLKEKILKPTAGGTLSRVEGMRIATGEEGSVEEGCYVKLWLLVDESDGKIADAKFQVFGETALIGAAEIVCELLLRKNYDQARRITADLIDTNVRDKGDVAAFPEEAYTVLNRVLCALDEAVHHCEDIPLEEGYTATPVDLSALEAGDYPDWKALSDKERLATIQHIIEIHIKPYIELDEGGIEIKELKDLNLFIKYQGSCTTCYSATGSTLSAIQQILRAKVHPELVVTPDL